MKKGKVIPINCKKLQRQEEMYTNFLENNFGKSYILSSDAYSILWFLQGVISVPLFQILWATLPKEEFNKILRKYQSTFNRIIDTWVGKE